MTETDRPQPQLPRWSPYSSRNAGQAERGWLGAKRQMDTEVELKVAGIELDRPAPPPATRTVKAETAAEPSDAL